MRNNITITDSEKLNEEMRNIISAQPGHGDHRGRAGDDAGRVLPGGRAGQHFTRHGPAFVVPDPLGAGALACGLTLDMFTVIIMATSNFHISLGGALATFLFLSGLWFAFPWHHRNKKRKLQA